jgi:hypothetical protein
MLNKSKFSRIYIVFTNYQFKVALVHLRSYPVKDSALLAHHHSIVPSGGEIDEFGELIAFQAETGIRSEHNRKAFHLLRQKMELLLADCEANTRPELLICSLAYPLTNWLLAIFHERLRTSILIDGLSGYLSTRKPFTRELSDAIRKVYLSLFFGIETSWIFKHPQGLDSPFVHHLYAEMPELLSAHGKPVYSLPSVFMAPDAHQCELARGDVWFLGQPHALKGKKLVELLVRMLVALKTDHPEARRFIYRTHHFEAPTVSDLIRGIGFTVQVGQGCVEELLRVSPPIAVYSYRSTALLNLRRTLPPEIPVVAFAPWLVQPPEEKLLYGDIQLWMLKLGIDRPKPTSAVFALDAELERRGNWLTKLLRLVQ